MPLYRRALPQLAGKTFLTDGGLETTLVFLDGIDLPFFAAFPLVMEEAGPERLRAYFRPYLATAMKAGVGFILDTPTWRATPDWGEKLGYPGPALDAVNRQSVTMAEEMRRAWSTPRTPIVINGVIGPRGDGYRAGTRMTAADAERYHRPQVESFAATEADMVSAITMTCPEEAIGIARAAKAAAIPVVISFTVETDALLPSGDALGDAIGEVVAETGGAPAYYMVNCAHPTHFEEVLAVGGAWVERIHGIRANASTLSHAELDAATELDPGDPQDLGRRYRALGRRLPRFSVMGGCCGTDHRHIAAICAACVEPGASSLAKRLAIA